MENFREKVEKTGSINFPSLLKKNNLKGSVILDVGINEDGSVRDIKIRRTSGHKLLDDAVIKIIHLAEPFSPLSDEILGEIDVLHITRTWKFPY